jgi:4-amino-4-deoxy-L-arabinose transferase-like glycosyltransferase
MVPKLSRITDFFPILAIFLGALFIRCIDIAEPFIGHHEWGAAFYSSVAINHLKYGFFATNFLDMPLAYSTTPDQFVYYIHYPPLLGILTACSLFLFGVHEWATRLIPIGFSLASLLLVYAIATRLWSRITGPLAAFFFAFMPMAAYFGRVHDVEIAVTSFALLMIYGYIRWDETREDRWFLVMLAGLLLGGLVHWAAFPLPFLLLFHHLATKHNAPKSMRILILPIISVLLFFGILGYFLMVTGSLESLLNSLFYRAGTASGSASDLTIVDWISLELRRSVLYFTPVVMVLTVAGLAKLAREVARRETISRNLHLMVLWGYGLIPLLLFRQAAWVHNYFLWFLLPATAITAAIGAEWFLQMMKSWLERRGNCSLVRSASVPGIVLLCIGGIFLLQAFPVLFMLHSWDTPDLHDAGVYLNLHTGENATVLASSMVFPQVEYYARRRFEVVDTLAAFNGRKADSSQPATEYLINNPETMDPQLKSYLLDRYPVLLSNRWIILNLTATDASGIPV